MEEPANSVVFPPAATWYRTNATSSRDDMWAYVAAQMIVLVKPKVTHVRVIDNSKVMDGGDSNGTVEEPKDLWPTFEVLGYQRENYNCLSFCQSPWDYLVVKDSPLATGCREGYVRIWNTKTKECVMYYDLHKKKDKNVAVTCLDWSVLDPKVIYSMDEEGTLVSLYIPKGKLKSTTFPAVVPTSLQASLHDINMVAIGSKSGVIYIVQTDPKGSINARILHKMRHDEEIVATLWCPKLGWSITGSGSDRDPCSEAHSSGPILASSIQSIKSPTIRLWTKKAEDRGLYHVWGKDRHSKPFRNFSPLLWATDPNSGSPLLLTSSKFGGIVSYSSGSSISGVVHDIHNHSSIFGLVQCGDILWSTSYEPVIVGYNLRTNNVHCVIPTFKGVNAIAPSPSVSNKLAFGGVDACIRVIDFPADYPKRDSIKSPLVSTRMRSKIMALAWHPRNDHILGFGTDDGILGTFEVKEGNRNVTQFDHRVSGIVYSVDWGPFVTSKVSTKGTSESDDKRESTLFLFACGGNSVFCIHPSKSSNQLVHVAKIIANTNQSLTRISGLESAVNTLVSKATDLRWAPDYSLLAVGYNDGRVELYKPPFLQLKCWIKCHSRAIQFLSWRTSDFIEGQLKSEHTARWLATASNDATLRLFDLKNICEPAFLENDTEEPKLLITSQAKLSSPSTIRIISCAWSHHDPNLLVTVSYDCTAIVWEIRGEQVVGIARYFGHRHRLVACTFHPTSPYEIVSASDECLQDAPLHVWDYRNHPYKDDIPSEGKKIEKMDPLAIKSEGQMDADEEEKDEVVPNKVTDSANRIHVSANEGKKKSSKNAKMKSLLVSTNNALINSKFCLEAELRYLVNPNFKTGSVTTSPPNKTTDGHVNGSTEMPKSTSGKEENGEEPDKEMIHLGILGNYNQCLDLMKVECEWHASRGNWERGCILAWLMSDCDFFERAVNEGHVTETMAFLSKSMSKTVMKKVCTKFAEQLQKESPGSRVEDDAWKAATVLLYGGLKKEAVDLLVEHHLYRDALAVLITNQTKSESMTKPDVLNNWLKSLVEAGNFETAAKVYCSMGQYADALTVVEKRDHPYAWKAGMFLADLCGDLNRLKVLGLKYCVDCIVNGHHLEAKEVASKYTGLKWLLPFVLCHEAIFTISNSLRDSSSLNGDFKSIMQNQVDLDAFKADGLISIINESILIAIAQNKNDAQVMLIKCLLMKLTGVDGTNNLSQEDFIKLCDTWLKEKEPFFYASYLQAYQSILA